jgi:lipopolysaccharide/colanic/teichoic acid biosynthesis glycosyltransferase
MLTSVDAIPVMEEEERSDSLDMLPSEFTARLDEEQDPVRPRSQWYPPVKAAIEWCVALVLFILSAPLVALLAITIKLTSPGPVFYAQTRLGRNGRTYRILKLRSMVQNAEAGTGAVWASKSDSRITPIGKVLRRTHLDELPQLLNVLRGEMGLIGPRPERPEIACRLARHVAGFDKRLRVRPGITGLAQMLLPADDPTDTEYRCVRAKLTHDLYYVREVSFLLDLRIAISTPCYFVAAMIDGIRVSMLGRYGKAIESDEAVKSVGRSGSCGRELHAA